eukprot:7794616-Pyramimonas_sp.AAC.1
MGPRSVVLGGGGHMRAVDLGRHGNGKSVASTETEFSHTTVRTGSLGVESLLRHPSLLGAL